MTMGIYSLLNILTNGYFNIFTFLVYVKKMIGKFLRRFLHPPIHVLFHSVSVTDLLSLLN